MMWFFGIGMFVLSIVTLVSFVGAAIFWSNWDDEKGYHSDSRRRYEERLKRLELELEKVRHRAAYHKDKSTALRRTIFALKNGNGTKSENKSSTESIREKRDARPQVQSQAACDRSEGEAGS